MKFSKLAAYLVLILFIQTCYSTEPDNGDPPPPPGYQEDIPWPSLADSPWPMNRGNPQGTGRSKLPGPQSGILEWDFNDLYLVSSVVIGEDGTTYFNPSDGLYAVRSDGTVKWFVQFGITTNTYNSVTPIISSDGTVYAANSDGIIYAINPDGGIKWEFNTLTYPNMSGQIGLEGLSLGFDGTLYFVDKTHTLYALSADGKMNWNIQIPDLNFNPGGSITFSPDGTVMYLPGVEKSIYSFEINSKSIVWGFGDEIFEQTPLIDSQGNIYISTISNEHNDGKASLYSLSPEGSIRWSYIHNRRNYIGDFSEPTMDKFGNIYLALDTLHCLDYSGNLKWKLDIGTTVPLVCDINGLVYINYQGNGNIAVALNENGEKLWELTGATNGWLGESPALGNEVMYVVTFRSNSSVFSIK